MFEFLKKNTNNKDKVVTYICDKELRKDIRRWLNSVYLDDVLFENVLLKLGLNVEKTIYLKKVSNSDGLAFYYGYEPDFKNKDRIDFCTMNKDNKTIILSGDGYRKNYVFVYDGNDKDGFRLDKKRDIFMKNINGGTYFHEIELSGFCIRVKNKYNNEVILNCSGHFDLEIKNELELENYLVNLFTLVSVDEVYKKICEISLDDESKFSKVDLILNKDGEFNSSLSYSKEDLFLDFTPKRKFYIKDKDREVIFYRYLPNRNNDRTVVQIEVISGDYRFVLKVKRVSYNGYAELENELKLRDYLLNLKFPISIDKLCNEIISMTDLDGRDSKLNMEIYYKNIKTDFLYFEHDYLKQFKITRDGKEITYDNGVYSYVSNQDDTKVYVDIWRDEVIRYGFETKKGNGFKKNKSVEKTMNNPIELGINDANEEIVKIRKLTDKMFSKR